MNMVAQKAEIFEVGPRDGLQNEPNAITLAEKIALVDLLSSAGFSRIEVASFVSPKWVPQMAESAEVLAGITRNSGTSYAALTPNLQGYEAARNARADEVAIFASASEGFSRANLNASIEDSLRRFADVAKAAQNDGIPLRGYVSCVTDCPFDGPVAAGAVARVVGKLRALGCYEVSLGDTLGRGTPEKMDVMLKAVLDVSDPAALAGHFHDTGGRALQNVDVALACGVRVFDAAVGGLGGCPYAPGAAGNVATESLVRHLRAHGFETGLDVIVLDAAAEMAKAMRGT